MTLSVWIKLKLYWQWIAFLYNQHFLIVDDIKKIYKNAKTRIIDLAAGWVQEFRLFCSHAVFSRDILEFVGKFIRLTTGVSRTWKCTASHTHMRFVALWCKSDRSR